MLIGYIIHQNSRIDKVGCFPNNNKPHNASSNTLTK